MRWPEAERFLLEQQRFGMRFGLENIRAALGGLGHPERRLFAVTVAGSKGKGSVAAFLEAILLAAGHRVGLYTSPHLLHVTERIRVGGAPIGRGALARLIGRVRARLGAGVELSYFEWLTAAALEHFAARRAAPVILEVGLGGRLDAVNAVDARCAAITGIEREHVDLLGSRLGGIAAEKAGVMRRGAPCVVGRVRPAVRSALASAARRSGALPIWLEGEASWSVRAHCPRGLTVRLRTPRRDYGAVRIRMLGRHQAHNAALAAVVAERLDALGVPVPRAAVRAGLARAEWPGRLDLRPGRPAWLLDGAHTADSAAALAAALRELFPSRRIVLVFGALRDKNIPAMAAALFPLAVSVFVVRPPEDRGCEPGEVLRRVPAALRARAAAAADLPAAVRAARAAAGSRGLVVVTGSLFLVGEALRSAPPPRRRR